MLKKPPTLSSRCFPEIKPWRECDQREVRNIYLYPWMELIGLLVKLVKWKGYSLEFTWSTLKIIYNMSYFYGPKSRNLNFSAIGQSSSRMTRTASAGHGHGSHVWQPGIGEVGLAKATTELVFDVF